MNLKSVIVFAVILNVALAVLREDATMQKLKQSQAQAFQNDEVDNKLVVRRKRFLFGTLQSLLFAGASSPLQALGVRGPWRMCRVTKEGASVYTNGIDTVCQGFCSDREITCNDYCRPYAYTYY